MFVFYVDTDLGMEINAQCRGHYFERGEIVQRRVVVNDLIVWIEHNTRSDLFRVAFGASPDYPAQITRAEALVLLHSAIGLDHELLHA